MTVSKDESQLISRRYRARLSNAERIEGGRLVGVSVDVQRRTAGPSARRCAPSTSISTRGAEPIPTELRISSDLPVSRRDGRRVVTATIIAPRGSSRTRRPRRSVTVLWRHANGALQALLRPGEELDPHRRRPFVSAAHAVHDRRDERSGQSIGGRPSATGAAGSAVHYPARTNCGDR